MFFLPIEYVKQLSDDPVMQGVVAALCTLILEDPTVISCGIFIAEGSMNFWSAWIGLTIGITGGDLGLYMMGRFGGKLLVKRRWVSPRALKRAREKLQHNIWYAVFLSRFLPGTRIPTFAGAGLVKAPVRRFLLVALAASTVWTFGLLWASILLGEVLEKHLGDAKWFVLFGFLAAFVLWRILRPKKNEPEQEPADS